MRVGLRSRVGLFAVLMMTIAPASGFAADAASLDLGPLQRLPVQDGGRVKPLEIFAQESLRLIYGRTTFRPEPGDDGQKRPAKPALEIVMTWILAPQLWESQALIRIDHTGLKRALQLVQDRNGNGKIDGDEDRKHFSPAELVGNARLGLVFQELQAKRETKEKLDPYFQAVQTLENQLGTLQAIRSGQLPRVAPPPLEQVSAHGDAPLPAGADTWISINDLDGDLREKFLAVTKAFIAALPKSSVSESDGLSVEKGRSLEEAVSAYISVARAQNPPAYDHDQAIAVELHYNRLHPFRVAWVLYLFAALAIGFSMNTRRRWPVRIGWILIGTAFLIHTYGFGLRVFLTGRPPVSNMYETVVWVAFGAVLFSMIFELLRPTRYLLLAGSVVAVLSMVIADAAPAVLDASLQPLEPVLRSTLWLTVHVMTITISYAALFLAWMLGLFGLYWIFRGDASNSPRIREITQSAYRAIQVGVVLLAAGIILGGVWADYSWGRFWGWDPKETWALIALLGYIALLHARLAGWVREFGMMVGSVVAASLVIMAWYGVNFVLGAGLHSYGFGAGGVEYVGGAIALQLIWVGYVAFVERARRLSDASSRASSSLDSKASSAK